MAVSVNGCSTNRFPENSSLNGISSISLSDTAEPEETTVTDESAVSDTPAETETTAAETNDKTEKSSRSSKSSDSETGNPAASESRQSPDNKTETLFTERDLEQTADTSEAKSLTAADNTVIDITDEGVYTISGNAKNCTFRISADDSAKIQLVLDGVTVENEDFPVIYVLSADKVFITSAGTENSLTVSGQFRSDGENNTDAVIYSKDDTVLNGTGTLNVISYYGNGISCKDDLKITGGTYNVNTALDAFEANDTISVYDGNFSIKTNKDGFHCENDEAEGTVTVSGGTFSISSGSDGIQACALLQIDGGEFDITTSEGLEATYIVINDGNIVINAGDDGINATSDSAAYETSVVFNGGSTTVTVAQGDTDAVDSNGSVYVNGGTINITAQMSSFDYDRTAEFNGGTIIINGKEVSEIPQSMMGGGMRGGMNGGMNGGRGGRSFPQ
ncbi:MAG: carbohydrate-binding domain-containing protein [Oscillospiraceae bacterium]|nr:carbohydrate-binding domain-containing protein [Oscillospiraceae bacterium]